MPSVETKCHLRVRPTTATSFPERPRRRADLRTVPIVDGHEWLTAYQQQVRDIGVRAQRAQTELRHVEATTTNHDGAVTVTVNPAGALLRLVLHERADQLTRVQLAEVVLATARQAQARAAREAIEAVAPLLGERSEAIRVLRAYLPEAGPR